MIGRTKWRWLVWIVGFVAMLGHAEQRVDLYQVEALVPNQSAQARSQAAAEALAQVLVRATGDAHIEEDERLAVELERAQSYVLQFGYGRTDQTLINDEGEEMPAVLVRFQFSEPAVEKLLKRLQLPVWPANRPSLLVWLVQDQWPDGRVLVTDAQILAGIKAEAMRRGLPVQFPLWDLQDQMALTVDQLWAFDAQAIRAASVRYPSELIVVGRFSKTSSGQYRGVWQWLDGEQQGFADAQADAINAWAAPMVDQLADTLAARYAIQPGLDNTGQLLMTVVGVDGFSRYREVLNYLEALEALASVRVARVEGANLFLSLTPESDLAHLQRALALDRKLLPEPTLAPVDGSVNNPLMYRWYR